MRKIAFTAAVVLAAVALLGSAAHAQRVTMHVQSKDIYAGLPFVLAVSAEGFEPEPEPRISELQIPGCEVTFLGVSPNVSTSVVISNGRRSESRQVEFVYRYRVEARQPGTYQVPAVTVTQDDRRASTRPATFHAGDVDGSSDMRLSLSLPERPVWVGETFDLTIDWYLRRDPSDPSFSIPLLEDPSWVDVHVPDIDPGRRREVLAFAIGDRDVELPYTRDTATVGGVQYTRFRFTVPVTPIRAGTLNVEPAQVVAGLQVGTGRDTFGFPVRRTRLFKATDEPRTLTVKPLPVAGRPPSFANAVGTAFSVQVQASRTVVQVGDPIELQMLIRGNGRLEGMSLPDLINPQGLPAAHFTVADSPATGEIVNDGKGKLFRVTVRLTSAEAREIPRLGFSYFDPERGTYETVYSEPIALSVQGSSVVGAGDVVSAVARPAGAGNGGGGSTGGQGPAGLASFVGADLSLSSEADTLDAGWSVGRLAPVLYILYALPLLLLVVRLWQVSTRERRGESRDARQALRAVREELDRAARDPARESAPRVLAALRTLARVSGHRATGDVVERIETESFSPAAARKPLDAALRDETRALAESWARDRGSSAGARGATAAALLLAVLIGGGPGGSSALAAPVQPAQAAGASAGAGAGAAAPAGAPGEAAPDAVAGAGAGEAAMAEARAAYGAALNEEDRDARTSAFARAEALFRALAARHPDRPELLADWGNAALGAQDLGRATLAYRRALALEPGLARAERNLVWVRERAPSWLPRPARERASDSLFFWHHALSMPARHLAGAIAFAAAVLLIAPWGTRRTRLLRRLAIVPALVWAAMVASILAQGDPADDAVVLTDGVPLLSADSPGAPPALPTPLPAGTEVTIQETRDIWTRVALASGTKGWLQSSTLERVRPDR